VFDARRRSRSLTVAWSAGALLAAMLLWPSGSSAALRFAVATSPDVVEFGVTQQLTYSVRMTAVGRAETFAFGFRTPRFAVVDDYPVEGSPLKFTGETLDLRGGTLLGPASVGRGVPACARDVPAHGGEFEARSWDVHIPANGVATAVMTFAILPVAPWPQTNYGMDFLALRTLNSRALGTLRDETVLRVGGPRISGPRGVHIRLESSPRGGVAALRGSPVVRRGRTVTVRGSTQPQLPNATLRLTVKHFAAGGRIARRAVRVRTDRDGRFVRRVRLQRRGRYAIGATYRTTRPDLVSDYACPLGFRVR
jgi:hypothetical protein